MSMWGIGVAVYFVAVIFRTSLGVAGLQAQDRFEVGASALSAFSILQLLVYAGMQIPVGLLVDRFGTKHVLVAGSALFTCGQLAFALSQTYGTALAARALLGCGDAMTFISVLRLGTVWFPVRRGPLIAQAASLIGLGGNLVATVVIVRVLGTWGWTTTFAGSSLAGVVVFVLVLAFLRNHPKGHEPPPGAQRPAGAGFVRRQVAAAWREPGTRLGMWTHFTTQFPMTVFLLLWGMPFLTEAQGVSAAGAGGLLTLSVLSNLCVGLVYGQMIARRPGVRLALALATVGVTATFWAAVLLWPGRAPTALLVALCLVLGACGPASMIGFEFARPANPADRQGTASGIVNIGGFTASMIMLLAVGVLLDVTGDDYRIAFAAVFVLQALGVTRMLTLRHATAVRERHVREGDLSPGGSTAREMRT
ncbi:nitrate/nitrite transporter [Streptomyces sp. NPDC050422]|uniref:nitrate/nitrite transporter n=1 Tax=Streptomyces sp. NPDC050422 TaxID=3365614 RepID=UPI00379C5174